MIEGRTKISGIYGLVDDGVIMYIGQAKDIHKRYRQHCSLAQNRGTRKVNRWLYELIASGRKPGLVILEVTSDLDAREVYWLEDYRKVNPGILNMADGGHSFAHGNRAKQHLPWAGHHSPVQHILKTISEVARTQERYGLQEKAARTRAELVELNNHIRRVGLRKMNMILWHKHGRSISGIR